MSAHRTCMDGTPNIEREYKGKKHFSQSHRKTSLFGSENEEQIDNNGINRLPNDFNLNECSMNSNRMTNRVDLPLKDAREQVEHTKNVLCKNYDTNTELTSEEINKCTLNGNSGTIRIKNCQEDGYIHNDRSKTELGSVENVKTFHSSRVIGTNDVEQNTQTKNAEKLETSELNGLIKAAKERAERREQERYLTKDDKYIFQSKPTYDMEKCGAVQPPWYTDTTGGRGYSNVQDKRSSRKTASSLEVKEPLSTKESDYRAYSTEQLKEVRTPISHVRNKESVPWYPEFTSENLDSARIAETYGRSSSKIGESFMRVFGVDSQNSKDCRGEAKEQKAPGTLIENVSSLRNTPYAQHY